ncbi:MAG: hypothetical protein ACPG4Z_02135 [Chitinophagales bacterium]
MKVVSSLSMILFGLVVTAVSINFIIESSLWWIIGLLFGLFCIYQWTSILIKGGMSIAMLIRDDILYLTFDRTKKVANNLKEINTATFFTRSYHLYDISRLWKYTFKVNGGTTSEEIKIVYQGQKHTFIDLNEHELKLKDDDLYKIVNFLGHHHPNIQIGKP